MTDPTDTDTAPPRPARPARRLGVLALLLAVVGLLVPNAGATVPEAALVKVRAAEGLGVEGADGDDVVWILAVGSDARRGERMTRVRGDALQLVGIDTRTGAASAIGIPRDSYVTLPGSGTDRVNAAMVYGGPQLLADTVAEMFGVAPDYVFVTRFEFFEDMVDDIGGITVRNPRFFDDGDLKPLGFERGEIRLTGYGALAFSRIRKSLLDGDFDRSANQQRVLRGIHRAVLRQADRPGFLAAGATTVLEHTQTDLGLGELYQLARAVASVKPGSITTCVLRGGYATVNGASVVTPDLAAARRYGDQARRDATIDRC